MTLDIGDFHKNLSTKSKFGKIQIWFKLGKNVGQLT
jgi:hypothetical protein